MKFGQGLAQVSESNKSTEKIIASRSGVKRNEESADLQQPVDSRKPLIVIHQMLEHGAHNQRRRLIAPSLEDAQIACIHWQIVLMTVRGHLSGRLQATTVESVFNEHSAQMAPTRPEFNNRSGDVVLLQRAYQALMVRSRLIAPFFGIVEVG